MKIFTLMVDDDGEVYMLTARGSWDAVDIEALVKVIALDKEERHEEKTGA